MFGRVIRTAFDIGTTFFVLAVIALGLLGWRLSAGPISLDFMTPQVARALSAADGSTIVDIDATELNWSARRTLDIRVRGVRLLGPDGKLLLDVPQIAISLSGRAMLRGVIAPTSLEVSGVQLALTRTRSGEVQFRSSADSAPAPEAAPAQSPLAGMFAELLAPPDPERALGYLESAAVIDTTVTISDEATGRMWQARDADVTLYRELGGLRLETSATVDIGAKPSFVSAAGIYRNGIVSASAGLADVDPAQLATLSPALAPLAGISMPLSGRVTMQFDPSLAPLQGGFEFFGRDGRLQAAAFGLPADVAVRNVSVRGRLPDGLTTAEIEEATADLGGPTLCLTGRIVGLDGDRPRAEISAGARNVPVDDLRRLWPAGLGENARRWIVENLSAGRVSEATADVVVRRDPAAPGDGWRADKVAGIIKFSGVDVNYLAPMPRVRGIDGQANFTATEFNIVGGGGSVGELRATAAKVRLFKLDTNDETADIDVDIAGPLRDALFLVDGEPLGYLRKIGLSARDFTGAATAHLKLGFPLKKTLKLDELEVLATAHVVNVTQINAALGQDARDGDLDLRIDAKGLDIAGRVTLGAVPADVQVRRNFADNAPFVGRTQARGRATAADSPRFGVDLAPYVDGPIDVAVDYTERKDGSGDLGLDLGLDQAKLEVDDLDWSKQPGEKAAAKLRLALAGGRVVSIPDFSFTTGAALGAGARGRIEFAADGKTVSRAEIASLKLGLNDARLTYVRREDRSRAIEIAGASFNAGPAMSDKTPPVSDRPGLELRVDVDRLYFAPDRRLSRLSFAGRRSADRWETASLSASTGDDVQLGQFVSLSLTEEGANQKLDLRAEDGGAFLRALDITPSIVGGALTASGATDARRAGRPLVGRLHMDAFRAVKAPTLARLLGVALLTGIVDTLSGQGVGFSGMNINFAYYGSRIEVIDAAASGSSLGITSRGTIDLDAATLDLDGTIVPANLLNSLPARIPLLGPLITGGGGGVFAATYRLAGPIDSATPSVNPLTTFAPGFLRNLFGGAAGVDTPPERQPQSGGE